MNPATLAAALALSMVATSAFARLERSTPGDWALLLFQGVWFFLTVPMAP